MAFFNGPLLLAQPTALPAEARACLEAHADVIQRVYILGGTSAVGDGVRSALETLTNGSAAPVFSEQRQIVNGQYADTVREFDADRGPNGALHMVWRQQGHILYRRLDRFGNTVIATVELPAGTSGMSTYAYPAVACVPGDGAVVVWRVDPTDELWALKLDEAGRLTAGPRRIYSGTSTLRFIDAAADGRGRVHIVSRDGDGRVTYGIFDADTLRARLAMTPAVSPMWNQLCLDPMVRAWPDGSADMVWYDRRDDPSATLFNYQLYRTRLAVGADGSSAPPGPHSLSETRLTWAPGGYGIPYSTSNSISANRPPAVAFEPDGSSQVAWLEHQSKKVIWTRLGPNGDVSVPERVLVSAGEANVDRVGIALGGDQSAGLVFPPILHCSDEWGPADVRATELERDHSGRTGSHRPGRLAVSRLLVRQGAGPRSPAVALHKLQQR